MQPKKKWKEPSAASLSASTSEAPPLEQQLYLSALKSLTRRQYSLRELEQKLLQSCQKPALVSQVVERLKGLGYIDDRRFAQLFIQSRLQNKLLGRSRILAELTAKGIDPAMVREILESDYPATDETQSLTRALEKKLKTLSAPRDEKKMSRLYNHLLRCGFPAEAVRVALRQRFPGEWG